MCTAGGSSVPCGVCSLLTATCQAPNPPRLHMARCIVDTCIIDTTKAVPSDLTLKRSFAVVAVKEIKAKHMAKRMVHGDGGGGILKKRTMKRSKKNSIHKVIDYLISDCYLFGPLISSSPLNSCRARRKGVEIREAAKDKRSLVKKIEEYLKSDCYMYASVIAPQSLRAGGRIEYVKNINLEVTTTTTTTTTTSITRGSEGEVSIAKEKRVSAADFVEQQDKSAKESVKRSIYPYCRAGEGMRDPKIRNIIVD